MKRIFLLLTCFFGSLPLFAQNEKKDGDDMVSSGNYSGAAIMYRLCMDSDEQCQIKLFKLIYDEKIEPESSNELLRLISSLANNENAEAQYYLGNLYIKGIGGASENFVEGIKWLQKSADKGFDEARKELITLNEQICQTADNIASAANYSEAANLYRLCKDTNEQCMLKLFGLIHDGKVEPLSTDEAYQLISPLAQQGNAEAQYYLGIMYRKGTGGVLRDESESTLWLQLSADQGYLAAQNELIEITPKQETPSPQEKVIIVPQEKVSANNNLTNINTQYEKKKKSSKGAGFLITIGGIGIAAGAAATYLLPPEKSEDWSDSHATQTYKEIEKRNPVYLIAGGIVGGVCLGTGIILKAKKNAKEKNIVSEDMLLQPPVYPDNNMRLNLIATNNGAGFRLTF